MESCEVAIVGSGFAGSLLARVLAVIGYDVALIERGTHPRFAIGESSTPLANLSLERIGTRYGLPDCYRLATHGRWLEHFPALRRGLKRGFTFYRHHPHEPFANRGLDSERLLVAASPEDRLADTHWFRADVDDHFVREAIRIGVHYRDRTTLSGATFQNDGVSLTGEREGQPFVLHARFVVDASGPGGFLAAHVPIASALDQTVTRSALLYSHFDSVGLMQEHLPGLPAGPYPDDWAAVHHLIDEGWMYSLRFDHGVTSAGFLLTPTSLARLRTDAAHPEQLWRALLQRYPTLGALFSAAAPQFPLRFHALVQHRLVHAAGDRWALLPHTYAFVDPLFSTGIAWALLGVERLAMAFENARGIDRRPSLEMLARYDALLSAEADQIDLLIAGAYEAIADFGLFAAQAMLYFATVSFAETMQRIAPERASAWSGFLGVGDEVTGALPGESLRRLRAITASASRGKPSERETAVRDFEHWVAKAVAPRNVAGVADPGRRNLYPVDLDMLIGRHELLGLSRDRLTAALPLLRGMAPEPPLFAEGSDASRSTLPLAQPSPEPGMPAPH